MGKKKSVFVAATRQNDGKTMTSIGLFHNFKKRFSPITYMKPVGQQYLKVDSKKIDKDAVLFQKIYDLKSDLSDISPIAVERGFTENYILNGSKEELQNRVKDAYNRLEAENDFVLIEGTGHAGVGSVFDLSNADVAKLVGSKVILVSIGGIGKSIDELILNKACFDKVGVELCGVIINKVLEDKYEKINKITRLALEKHGIRVLGMIPYVNMLTKPTVEELYETLDAEILSGAENLLNPIEKYLIGAMLPHEALNYFEKNTLLVVPSNREGIVMTALCGSLLKQDVGYNISGIIFCGAIPPHPKILDLIKLTNIPVLLVQEDSFSIATKLNQLLVKVRSGESEKIQKIQNLTENYVDIDAICELL